MCKFMQITNPGKSLSSYNVFQYKVQDLIANANPLVGRLLWIWYKYKSMSEHFSLRQGKEGGERVPKMKFRDGNARFDLGDSPPSTVTRF